MLIVTPIKNLRILKLHSLIVIILLTIGLFLRIYSAFSVPFIDDEEEKFPLAAQISFNLKNLNLPIGSEVTHHHPLLSTYILKLGLNIFGRDKIGGRLPFIILSTLSLYFIYKLVKESLGGQKALLILVLLIFSQYHIGISRLIAENTLLLTFTCIAMYFFFKFINTQKSKWVFLSALAIGFGYLSKEFIILLIPVFLIFILIDPKNRKLLFLKKKEIILGFIIMLLIMSPHLIWSIKNNFSNFTYKQQHKPGFSLRSFYLYFAELAAIMSDYKPEMFIWPSPPYRVSKDRDIILRRIFPQAVYFTKEEGLKIRMDGIYEFPVVDLATGIIIFFSIFYILLNRNKKEDLIKFSLVMFFVTFLIPCLFDPSSLFSSHQWASMSFFPGMIIVTQMLNNLSKRHYILDIFIIYFIIYTIGRALFFINLPENCFLAPRSEFYELCLERAELYKNQANFENAIKICNYLLKSHLDKEKKSRAERILNLIKIENIHK
jgi:4-amino-4-deoxy-L-arabinose transferase-like glycosyltransferase